MHRKIKTYRHFVIFSFLSLVLFSQISCASYRVVSLSRGTDKEGEIRNFYAVAENNVIIPEYAINERGEYPTESKTAWNQFKSRRDALASKMRERYRIPNSAYFSVKSGFFAIAYTVLFPVTFPAYYFINDKKGKSVSDYYGVMVYGEPREPELRKELENY
jgi:hypothetical protein